MNMTDYIDISRIVVSYYQNPQETYERTMKDWHARRAEQRMEGGEAVA
jgi:hypothetical protein